MSRVTVNAMAAPSSAALNFFRNLRRVALLSADCM
jgi:hypothetical protein